MTTKTKNPNNARSNHLTQPRSGGKFAKKQPLITAEEFAYFDQNRERADDIPGIAYRLGGATAMIMSALIVCVGVAKFFGWMP